MMLTVVLVGWALLAAGATVTALVRVRPRATRPGPFDDVIVLRPVDAPTPRELANLSQPLPRGVRHLVLAPFRPRLPTHVEWLPSDPPTKNRKLGHLRYALEVLRREALEEGRSAPSRLVIVDADVAIDEHLLGGLLSELDAGVDAAWAAPRPDVAGPVRGLLVQSLHSFDALDAISTNPRAVCGKAIALGPLGIEVLSALPDCVGEDLELAIQLHERGGAVRLAAHARMPGTTDARSALARFTRWMQVLRAHRPLLFPTVPLLFACTPLLVAAALVHREPLVACAVVVLVLARTALAIRAERLGPRPRSAGWWIAGEVLLLAAWARAFIRGHRIEWRGRELMLGEGGVLTAARHPEAVRA